MLSRDYFPLGVAVGTAFCNRSQETKILVENMKHGKHSLLMATRRYGKSSLALHALKLSDMSFVEIDFYMATNEKIIEQYILQGIATLIGKTLGPVEQLISSIKKYVKELKPKIELNIPLFKLELTTAEKSDPATNVKEGLLLLEKLLEEQNKRAVILMDEFQAVGIIAQGKGIEGAIRHVAQKTKYLTLVFSGSNRKLLQTMFEDETRPLYKLCWKISLQRITSDHYKVHLQTAANTAWGLPLTDDVFNEIMNVTERHPYYLNKLCDQLWASCPSQPPTVEKVVRCWMAILQEDKSDAIKEISLLSLGQKNVLKQLTNDSVQYLTGKQSMLALQMTSSSIMTAIEGLEEKDVIEKVNDRYHIINPVVRFYACNH